MTEPPEGLVSIQDFIRWGASRFNAAELFFGHGTDNPFDESAALVLHAIHLPPDLPADYLGCRLDPVERRAVTELLEARIRERKPAAYLTNRTWFAGLVFHITEDVLVPRSPLAELVESGFEPWVDAEGVDGVLDLCTGSGCIGIAAAVYMPHIQVDISDISQAALDVARQNLAEHGVGDRVHVIHSDLFGDLAGRRYDVIVSNPPYVGAQELASLPLEYQREPQLALAGGEGGLDLVVSILRDAPDFLNDDGILVIEVGNTAETLERSFPDIPFLWLDFERGGEGVFMMRKSELLEYRSLFVEAVRAQ